MSYQIQYTETTNPDKPAILVPDGTLNETTSLEFVGKNYSGYAPIIASNFLHLLENFASPESSLNVPSSTTLSNPVQGQLWYNTTTSTLNVYDGTNWVPAGSLKKGSEFPSIATAGDLFVNTTTSQLYLYSGSSYVLVGPQFSSGLQTGPIVESIVDTTNVTHNVVSFYASSSSDSTTGYRIAILSKDSFTPKSFISGFQTINEGINLSSVNSKLSPTNLTPTRVWGTAQQADALLVANTTVPAANFLRADIASTTNYALNIRSDDGLTIGSSLGFNIGANGSNTVLTSKNSGGSVSISTNNNGTYISSLTLTANAKLGLGTNNTNPMSTLDVAGQLTINDDSANSVPGRIIVNGTSDVSDTSTGAGDPGGASIQTLGGLSVAKKSSFGDDVITYGQHYINYLDSNSNPIAASVVLPGYSKNSAEATALNIPLVTSGKYDIGSVTRPFRNIFAENFSGNFSGTVVGANLSGSTGIAQQAAKLQSETNFSLAGDVTSPAVPFNGQTLNGRLVLNTTINGGIISTKPAADDSALNDQLLIYQATSSSLVSMTKQVFLSHVPTVPIGSIMPYAGLASNLPVGYLLCDGSEIQISDYPSLFAVIQYLYKPSSQLQGLSTFALPDLRGRFPLGADNMNNNLTVPSKDGSGLQISAGGGTANNVSSVTADLVGASSGSQNITLLTSNLPDHQHNLNDGSAQYYAVGVPNAATDLFAQPGVGLTQQNQDGQGYGLTNSGSVVDNAATSTPVTIMNPYTTINYIIFTGVL
jgi:microcystin-dependent protein